MPVAVKHILLASSVVLLVTCWICALRWPQASLPLLLSGFWMMGNLLFLSGLMVQMIRPREDINMAATMVMFTLKAIWFVGGLVALYALAPHSRQQVVGILAGTSVVILTIFLKAVGAMITGRSLFERGAVRKPSLDGSK